MLVSCKSISKPSEKITWEWFCFAAWPTQRHFQIWAVLPFDRSSLTEQLKTAWALGLLCFAKESLKREKEGLSLGYHRVISHQRKVSASHTLLGLRSGAGCTVLAGYPLLTDETLKGKLSFLAKDTGRRAKDDPLWNYMTAQIILWGLMSSSPSQSHPRSLSGSLTQASGRLWPGWGSCNHFHGGLQAAGLKGYGLQCPLILALFFIGGSNHIKVSWVFKWCIKGCRVWSLTSTEICWAAFAPIRGEFRRLVHPVLQLCGPNLALKSTALEPLLWLLKFTEHIWFTLTQRIWHLAPAAVNGISPSLNSAFWLSKTGCQMRDPCQL